MISEVFQIIDWTSLKARLHAQDSVSLFPYKREVWWASMGHNVGVEINGKNNLFERPVLIIKVFNTHSILVVPVTSRLDGRYNVNFTNNQGDLKSVNVSQMRAISTKRLTRKVGEITNMDFQKILDFIYKNIIKTETLSNDRVSSESSMR